MKKFLSAITSLCLLSILCTTAFATDVATSVIPDEPEDYGEPIQVTTFYDESLEATITRSTYFVPTISADSTTFDGKSGQGWYKNEDSFTWNSGKKTTYYVSAYFKWGNGKSEVSQASGDYDWVPSEYSIRTDETTTGEGQYGYIFNHYSYATYKLAIQNPKLGASSSKLLDVTIRVSENGNTI